MPAEETSARDRRTEEFLDVEQTARDLAVKLKRLEEETNRYSAAATNLDSSAAATKELVAAVREIGENSASALKVVASVGGPEIVSKLEELDGKLSRHTDAVSRRLQEIEDTQAEQTEQILKKVGLAVAFAGIAVVLGLASVGVALLK
jgi:hypothetical protein